jgi:hypothetical protein
MTNKIEFHSLAEIFPMLAIKELAAFADDIAEHGLREPIVMHEGKILDGRNRHAACIMAGAQPRFKGFDDSDPLDFVVSANLHRRHLTDDQRTKVAAKITTLKRGDNQHTSNEGTSQAKAAALFNASEAAVGRAVKVFTKGAPELVSAVEAREVSMSAAAVVASLPVEEQKEIVAKGPAAMVEAAKPKPTPEHSVAAVPKADLVAAPDWRQPGTLGLYTAEELAGLLHGSIPKSERQGCLGTLAEAVQILREKWEAARPKRQPKSRPQRWEAAIAEARAKLGEIQPLIDEVEGALSEVRAVQEEYEGWKESLPENLASSSLGEMLEAVCEIQLEDAAEQLRSAAAELETILQEAEGTDLPRGFGRD